MNSLLNTFIVYQKALTFSSRTLSTLRGFPRGYSALTDQWKRAAMSIPANLAEGAGRHSPNDKKHFYAIARGSANECLPYVEMAKRCHLIAMKQAYAFQSELEQIIRICNVLIKKDGSDSD